MGVLVDAGVRAVRSPARTTARGRAAAYLELTRPGITRLVSLSAAAGYFMASPQRVDLAVLAHTVVGTALVASGASAFNQYLEREPDARMRRTAGRPIPAGRVTPRQAALFATVLSALGVGYLLVLVGIAPALVDALTLLLYVWIYTPLKRVTDMSTLVGAVPGALPALAGWLAARASLSEPGGWTLFCILFFWQIPHFLALAWMFRDDYRRAGFVMLSMEDPDGRRTAAQSVNYSAALVLVSVSPTLVGLTGRVYLFGAIALGSALLAFSALGLRRPSYHDARRLFLASVLYLPLLVAFMVLDRAPR